MSNPIAQRNLLFGILALQRGIIDEPTLVSALQAWVGARTKGLAQILIERHALSENQHALVEERVHRHLARRGGDLQASLAAVSLTGTARQELEKLADPEVQEALAHVAAVPLEPEEEPESEFPSLPDEDCAIPVVAPLPAPPPAPAPKKPARRNGSRGRRRRQTPAWLLVVGGGVVGGVVGGTAAALVFTAILVGTLLRPGDRPEAPALALAKPDVPAIPREPIKETPPAIPGAPPALKESREAAPPVKEPADAKDSARPATKEPVAEVVPVKPVPGAEPAVPKPAPPAKDPVAIPLLAPLPGFVPLFNGKDLTGWQTSGPNLAGLNQGGWSVVDGILRCTQPNFQNLFTQRDDYGDFHLRLEARVSEDSDAKLAVRYPYSGADLERRQMGGYQVTLSGRKTFIHTGSVAAFEKTGGRTIPVREPMALTGQWFSLEVIAQGDLLTTKVNGQAAVNFVNAQSRLRGGRLALGWGFGRPQSVVEFRTIEIKEFKAVPPPPAPPPERPLGEFVSLFNGKDLGGWRVEGGAGWKVEPDGTVVGQGPDAALVTERGDYRSLVARVELSASADAEAFFAFRQNSEPAIKIYALTSRVTGDGNIIRAGYAGINANKGESGTKQIEVKPDESFVLEFDVKRELTRISANGKLTGITGYAPDAFPPGPLAVHVTKGTLRIKKFEVRAELTAGAPPALPPAREAGAVVPLYNNKDLTGWRTEGRFVHVAGPPDGRLTLNGPDSGAVTERADFSAYTLRAELSVGSGTEGYLAFKRPGPDTKGLGPRARFLPDGVLVRVGLAEDEAAKAAAPKPSVVLKPGQRFLLEAQVKKDGMQLSVNGEPAGALNFAPELHPTGAIGFFVAKGGLAIWKLEIKEEAAPAAPDVAAAEFEPLFNGKDLAGWQAHPKRPGNWRVENSLLTSSAPGGGSLFTARGDYKDFHLRAEVRINDQGFGRVLVRAAYGPLRTPIRIPGYEALLNQRPVGARMGSLTATSLSSSAVKPAEEVALAPGGWVVLEVIARGPRVSTLVNGKTVATFVDERDQFARQGHIALHQDVSAVVEFRKIEIKEFRPGP